MHGLFVRKNQPIFADAAFLIKRVFDLDILLPGALGDDFDDPVRRAVTTLLVQQWQITNQAQVGLDQRVDVLAGEQGFFAVVKPHIEWRGIHAAFFR